MKQDISKSIDACAAHYGDDAEAMRHYLIEGDKSALALKNRGPISFDKDGNLSQHILQAYSEYGFYIFEGVLKQQELTEIKKDLQAMRTSFPLKPGGKLTADGLPALGSNCKAPNLIWSKPLGDPLGGTAIANGRHQVKLFEPKPADDAPKAAPFILLGSLQFSDACLRTYAHPQLLKVAEAINGKDFAPFHECLFIKDPGVGAAVSWHQDGSTHWENDDFEENIHGFNFMAQVYGSTAVNGVWVFPGSHKQGKVDIKKLVHESGSERIKGAIPMVCNAGDVVICNRQLVHGSFANTGFEPRVTVNFGSHKRSSVLDVMGAGIHNAAQVFDEAHIEKRSQTIGLGIASRRQHFPEEQAYAYEPFEKAGKTFAWDDAAKQSLHDYNLGDLSI